MGRYIFQFHSELRSVPLEKPGTESGSSCSGKLDRNTMPRSGSATFLELSGSSENLWRIPVWFGAGVGIHVVLQGGQSFETPLTH